LTAVSVAGTAPIQASHAVQEQAAEWYALLRSEEVTESDRERWRAWLAENRTHQLAWEYVECVSSRFAPIQATTDPRRTVDSLWEAHARLRQRRRVLAGIAGLGAAGLMGWASWRHTPLPAMARVWQADYRTATGESRELRLADGTRVWLNTATAVNQAYTARRRRLELVAGEMLIDTARDPSRPLTVRTPQGLLRALGTRFTVRLDGEQTLLAVYDGAVAVRSLRGAEAAVQAGQQVRFSQHALAPVQPADPAREAWSRGVLVAQDMTLRELAMELRRYRHGHLGLAPEVADLRVFGNFPLDDTDATLDMLAGALPVRIRRTLPWWVSIEPDSVGRNPAPAMLK